MPGTLVRYIALLLIILLVPANSYALFGLEKLKRFKPISKKAEVQMGQGIAAKILGATPLVNDPELQQYVNYVGKWIALQTKRPNLAWRFGVIDTDTINAFACPGGYILITRGLLHDVAQRIRTGRYFGPRDQPHGAQTCATNYPKAVIGRYRPQKIKQNG